jgi:hypothetical protein
MEYSILKYINQVLFPSSLCIDNAKAISYSHLWALKLLVKSELQSTIHLKQVVPCTLPQSVN